MPGVRAHPHVCGEHPDKDRDRAGRAGSSPRMRGTRLGRISRWRTAGLIPTYAGNTMLKTPPERIFRAHPHVCGEHLPMPVTLLTTSGSSPRMRGTPHPRHGVAGAVGLIPTYAGNTPGENPESKTMQAHPHVCGEHLSALIALISCQGSSPRMRGTLALTLTEHVWVGLIPTYAGNTKHPEHYQFGARAHPHVCGEHNAWTERQTKRAWLIPTYAGNTPLTLFLRVLRGAHPHVCGEHKTT